MPESLHIGHTPVRAIKIPDSLWDAISQHNNNKSDFVRLAIEEKLNRDAIALEEYRFERQLLDDTYQKEGRK